MKKGDETILEDYSRLVNELVDIRREVSRLNNELKQKEEFLRNILQIVPSIIFAADTVHAKLLFSNRRLSDVLGFLSGDFHEQGGIPILLVHPDDREALEKFRMRSTGDSVEEFHFRTKKADGTEAWYRLKEKAVSVSGVIEHNIVIGSLDEITELKLNEASLKSESQRDFLTGLLNRRGFLEAAGERIKNIKGQALLLFIDIDHFKRINDEFGHETGDEVLKAFASLLSGVLRSNDIPARWGGDEFIALLSSISSRSFEAVHSRLQKDIDTFNLQRNHAWTLKISIGHVEFGEDTIGTLEGLIAFADKQMYESRRTERLD